MRKATTKSIDDWFRRRSSRYRWWRESRLFLQISRERDPQRNAETTPPGSEKIEWRAYWLAECFLPSHLPQFSACLDRLAAVRCGFGDVERTRAFVQEAVSGLRGGGWSRLGSVAPQDRIFGRDFDLSVPEGVNHVTLSVQIMAPSVVTLVATFFFDDAQAGEPDQILRRYFDTEDVRRGAITSRYDPEFGKQRAIRTLRLDMKRRGARWLQDMLGARGLFAEGSLHGGRLPAVEFWTTREAQPLADCDSLPVRTYLGIVGLRQWFEAWEANNLPGLRLSTAESDEPSDRDVPSHALILAARESVFENKEVTEYRGDDVRWATLGYLNDDISPLAAGWALQKVLTAYERGLSSARERLLRLEEPSSLWQRLWSFEGARLARALPLLEAVERDLLRIQADAVPFSADMRRSAPRIKYQMKQWRGTDYELVERRQPEGVKTAPRRTWLRLRFRWRTRGVGQERIPEQEESPPRFIESAVDDLSKRARELARVVDLVVGFQTNVSAAVVARANIRLQTRLREVTWVLVLLTVIGVLFAGIAVHHDFWHYVHRITRWFS